MLPQGIANENRKNEIVVPLVDPATVALEVKLLELHDQTDAPGLLTSLPLVHDCSYYLY